MHDKGFKKEIFILLNLRIKFITTVFLICMNSRERYIFSVDFYNSIKPISRELKHFIKANTRFMYLKKGDKFQIN